MKNIFLDCGSHLFEGLIDFYRKGIIDNSFEIHAFEANPACRIYERARQIPLKIQCYSKAIWVDDGFVFFNQENHKKSLTGSPTDGASDIDGWGSSVAGIGFTHPGYEEKIKIPSIDFSVFVQNLPNNANIICKMDIEGSEYRVLRHMIDKGVISKINILYLEFHERFMPDETKESEAALVHSIEEFGVKVILWG